MKSMTACSTSPRFFRRAVFELVIVTLQTVTLKREAVKSPFQNSEGSAEAGFGFSGLSRLIAASLVIEEYRQLGDKSCAGIQDDVTIRTSARRDEALVPLVKSGYKCRTKYRDGRPLGTPLRGIDPRKRFTPGAEQKDAEQSIAEDVTALTEEGVQRFKRGPIDAKQKVQNRIKKPACLLRREICRRLDGNHDEPQNQCDPGLQNMMTVGGHADWGPAFEEYSENGHLWN